MTARSEEVLEKLLGGLGEKRKRVLIAKGAAEFSLVLLISLGLVSLFAHVYLNKTYFSILKLAAAAAVCFGFAWFLVPALFKKERKTELALELETISPGLGENALNAFLLANDSKSGKELGVSKPLIEAHVDGVARKLEPLDLSPAVPLGKVKALWKPLAVAFVLSVTALASAPPEFRGFLFSSRILPTSEPRLIELADIEIEYRYPAYTGRSPKVVKRSSGDVKAVRGTQVSFRATPLKSLAGGEIIIENGLAVPLSSEGRKVKGGFMITSDGGFFIQGEDGKSRSKTFRITSEKDDNPKVAIEFPVEGVIEIEGEENLDIFYRAEDDFGLTKFSLVWDAKGKEGGKVIRQARKEPRSAEGKFSWDFGGVESEPGEVIEVRLKAYDNDTVSGPKFGVSNAIRVKLNDPQKRHENVVAFIERVMEELLDVLADDIQYRPDEGKLDVARAKETQGIIEDKVANALTSLNKTLDKMKQDDYSDYAYFLGLSNMSVRIEDLWDERRDALTSLSAENISKLDGLVTREINEFEDDILFLDSMLRGERLKDSLLYGRDTLGKYNELRELLESLKGGGDENAKREIAKKIEELRSLMAQLAQKFASMSGDIPEEFLNTDAFEMMDLGGELDEIAKLVGQGKIDEAMQLLARFEGELEGMIASLETGVRSFNSASLSKEVKKLSDVVSRIKGLEKEEESLKEKTEELKQSLLKEDREKENLLEFVRREKEKLARLENMLTEAKFKISGDTASDRESLDESFLIDRLLTELQGLRHWLQAFEFKEALRYAEEVEEQTDGLKNLAGLEAGNFSKADREIRESASIAQEIRRDLEGLQGQVKEERMHQFAERQDEIEKEASELADSLRGFQEDFSFPEGIGQKLGESKGFMQGSSGSLRKKEISKAISNQGEAIKSLRGAREGAESLLEKFQMSARGMGASVPFVLGQGQLPQDGYGIDTSYVDIPPPSESKAGKEFKENLLRALKEGSPEGFEELNKKYYERIIK